MCAYRTGIHLSGSPCAADASRVPCRHECAMPESSGKPRHTVNRYEGQGSSYPAVACVQNAIEHHVEEQRTSLLHLRE
eukprot:3148368-Heterocapsa_arctica.AAC.1